jgi:LuxR family maltose regulon positive regulatory protein
MGRVIEIMILEALALQMRGDETRAETVLTKSLALAEPEGYLRVFLDDGQPQQKLLARWLTHNVDDPLRDYASHLLSQFAVEPHTSTTAQDKATSVEADTESSGQTLVERLSPRELEVLELIGLGMTNKEIARQLVVSPGTVKAHTSSIYRKLDVANRTEAVASARQIGLLP